VATVLMPDVAVVVAQHVNLSDNRLKDGDIVTLCKSLMRRNSLISLDLSSNAIGASASPVVIWMRDIVATS
jgi:hypothetical protein